MKTTRIMIAVLVALLSFTSCSSSDSNTSKEESVSMETEKEMPVSAPEEVVPNNQSLVLNEGLRWEANIETTSGVSTMLEMIINQDGKSAEDLAVLQENLGDEFKGIFEKCTMTGESHIQLHNFLLPLKTSMNGLSAESEKERSQSLADLKAQLSLYPDFFE